MSSDLRSAAERLQELVRSLETEIGTLSNQAEVLVSASVITARREAAAEFHGIAQRLRGAEDAYDWQRTLIEAAEAYSRKVVWVDAANSGAAAVRNSLEQGETTVCAVTPDELGHAAATALAAYTRAWLIPVAKQGVLCVAVGDDEPDLPALELLGLLAVSTIPVQSAPETQAEPVASPLVNIQGAALPQPRRTAAAWPSWEELPRDQQLIHLRAQQFARVFVSDLVLHGPVAGAVYGTLKKEIDAGRDRFRREFFENCPGMVDYLHLELVRTLAGGDVAALGARYPGPLR